MNKQYNFIIHFIFLQKTDIMKAKISIFIIQIFIVIGFSHCSLDDDCFYQIEVPVIRLEMPDSVAVDSSVQIDIVYVTYSNCSRLNNLLDLSEVDTITFRVIADYVDCDCPETLPDSVVSYTFKSTVKRDYIFKAFKYDNTLIQDTLKVY